MSGDSGPLFSDLARLPALRDLYLDIQPDAGTIKIDQLPKLEFIFWKGGQITGDHIRDLAKGNKLKTLTLFNAEIADDFCEALPVLQSLTELNINNGELPENRTRLAKLPESLSQLPNLRNWPFLHHIDAAALHLIAGAGQIEQLGLSNVKKDVTPESLAELGKLKKLRRLEIGNIPVDDAWLRLFADAEDLETIYLLGTRVTGSGFEALTGLKNLKTVQLFFVNNVVHHADLSYLSRLPSLERFDMDAGDIPQQDCEPLRHCQQLRELFFYQIAADDTMAGWLSEMSNLRRIVFLYGGTMTDAGAQTLTKLSKLENLTVGGSITSKGVATLTTMPNLRSLTIESTGLSTADAAALKEAYPRISFNIRVKQKDKTTPEESNEQKPTTNENKETSTDKKTVAAAKKESAEKKNASQDQPIRLTAFGRVLDEAGKPVAGATVYLREWSTYRISQDHSIRIANRRAKDVIAAQKTDANGNYRFQRVWAKPLNKEWTRDNPWDVVVDEKGHAIVWQHLPSQNNDRPIDLKLQPESQIVCQVVDASGKPIEGVEAFVEDLTAIGDEIRSDLKQSQRLDMQLSELSPQGKSDRNGKIVFSGLPAQSRVAIHLRHDSYHGEYIYAATTATSQAELSDSSIDSNGKRTTVKHTVYPATFTFALRSPDPSLVGSNCSGRHGKAIKGLCHSCRR